MEIQHLESLDALHLQPTEYVICGSAAAVLYGAKRTNADIDVCIPQPVIDRLFAERLIVNGERDGIHDAGFQSLDGHVDINTPENSLPELVMSWDDWLHNAALIDGYPVLTKQALCVFYEKLAKHTHALKHIVVLAKLKC